MINFKGCKNLDFDQEKYTCELVGISNHLGWERRDVDGRIQLCQMCKLRGRLNSASACIGENKAMCNRYEEKEYSFSESEE